MEISCFLQQSLYFSWKSLDFWAKLLLFMIAIGCHYQSMYFSWKASNHLGKQWPSRLLLSMMCSHTHSLSPRRALRPGGGPGPGRGRGPGGRDPVVDLGPAVDQGGQLFHPYPYPPLDPFNSLFEWIQLVIWMSWRNRYFFWIGRIHFWRNPFW